MEAAIDLPMTHRRNCNSTNKAMVMVGRLGRRTGKSACMARAITCKLFWGGTPNRPLVASRLCDYLATSTFRPNDLAMPGKTALRLTDEILPKLRPTGGVPAR